MPRTVHKRVRTQERSVHKKVVKKKDKPKNTLKRTQAFKRKCQNELLPCRRCTRNYKLCCGRNRSSASVEFLSERMPTPMHCYNQYPPVQRKQSHISVITISSNDDDDCFRRTAQWLVSEDFEVLSTVSEDKTGCKGDFIQHQISEPQLPTSVSRSDDLRIDPLYNMSHYCSDQTENVSTNQEITNSTTQILPYEEDYKSFSPITLDKHLSDSAKNPSVHDENSHEQLDFPSSSFDHSELCSSPNIIMEVPSTLLPSTNFGKTHLLEPNIYQNHRSSQNVLTHACEFIQSQDDGLDSRRNSKLYFGSLTPPQDQFSNELYGQEDSKDLNQENSPELFRTASVASGVMQPAYEDEVQEDGTFQNIENYNFPSKYTYDFPKDDDTESNL